MSDHETMKPTETGSCSKEGCPSYDGKRCRLTGCRPCGAVCEPGHARLRARIGMLLERLKGCKEELKKARAASPASPPAGPRPGRCTCGEANPGDVAYHCAAPYACATVAPAAQPQGAPPAPVKDEGAPKCDACGATKENVISVGGVKRWSCLACCDRFIRERLAAAAPASPEAKDEGEGVK